MHLYPEGGCTIIDFLPEVVAEKNANFDRDAKKGGKKSVLDVIAPSMVEDKSNIHECK